MTGCLRVIIVSPMFFFTPEVTDLMSMFAAIGAQQIPVECGDMYAAHRRSWKLSKGFWRRVSASRNILAVKLDVGV